MKVFALIRDFTIETCELPHTPPPAMRTFLLTRKTFIERPKFVQGLFQRFWVLFLLTRAQCQVCVFHAVVCPNTFTRCWQRFRIYKIGDYIQPIITTVITFDRDTTDISVKLTVFMESIRDFIISPFTSVPFSEGNGDTVVV